MHKMTVASAYAIGKTRGFPVMQLNIKENIQNTTNGKVYVKLAPAPGSLASAASSRRRFRAAPSRPRSTRSRTSPRSRLPST